MIVTVLGCGASAGVPSIARGFGDCDPNNPKNIRGRSSVFIEENGRRLLIDASPDLRIQFLRENIKALDGVLLTHEHFDHTGGIVDLRDINRLMGGALNIYGSETTIKEVQERFPFIFEKPRMLGSLYLTPSIKASIIDSVKTYSIADFKVIASLQNHGDIKTFGYRINDFGYITDFSEIIDDYQDIFKGIKKLIIACQSLDNDRNPIHATMSDVLEIIDNLNVEKAYLTHMCPSIDYEHILTILPKHIEPAFDGLKFEV